MSADFDLDRESRLPSLRDIVAPIFRHKLAGLMTVLVVLAITAALVLLSPKQYEAEMKLLIKRERAETIVSSDSTTSTQRRPEVSEDELNSEVELIKSPSLLEQVAMRSRVVGRRDGGADVDTHRDQVERALGVRTLQGNLQVTPIRGTTFIRVSYLSPDPTQAVTILNQLANLYLEKHLELHRAPGAYQFFTEQVARYQQELNAAEARLKEFSRTEHVVAADVERSNALQQLAAFQASLQETRGQMAEATRRLSDLEAQAATTPLRQTTQIRKSENAELIRELESSILGLEVQRAEMLRKYAPTYPPVVEVSDKLAQARTALARVQESPLTEETTDQNPTHQWLRSELARVRTERAAVEARQAALAASVRLYEGKAAELEQKAAMQSNLRRDMKTAEDNYLLYLKKQEEARISDALDRTRIANVAVAEAPTVPALPSSRGGRLILTVGAFMAVLLGLSVTYLLHYLSPYFHTPDDVEDALNVPVLASLPRR